MVVDFVDVVVDVVVGVVVVVEVVVVVDFVVVVNVDVVVGFEGAVDLSSEKNARPFGCGLDARLEGKSPVIGDHAPAGVDVCGGSISWRFLSRRASWRCFLFNSFCLLCSCLSSRRLDRSSLRPSRL